MSIKGNNILMSVILIVLVLGALFYFLKGKEKSDANDTISQEQVEDTSAVTITSQEIKEKYFSGSMPVISGTNPLAVTARAHVEARIAEFKKSADEEVPDIRKQFGADSPTSNYTIYINALYLEDVKTNSIVMTNSEYTGGANGNSFYKVFTASRSDGKILSLSDIIKKEKQSVFTELVKKELIAWRPEGVGETVVFPDIVQELNFDYFTNWFISEGNLVLCFSKYEIGPGVLGAVAFPIPLQKIESMLY